jgi:NAD(P)-dependent dehydrogenase (short-subunit alcohol dehydrogenase family)
MIREWLSKLRTSMLEDKVVVITGGSRGLGLALAEEAGRAWPAAVVLCARDPSELERAVAQLAQRGVRAFGEVVDVRDQTDASRAAGKIIEQFGKIDVLVNDAGVIEVGPFAEMLLPDFREALDTNFYGPLHMMLAVLPHMRSRRSGRIINVGSIGGRIGVPHLAPYSAAKFALTGACEAVRAELRRDGIVLTLVQPGLMRTGSPLNARFKGRHRGEYAWFSIADALGSIGAAHAARAIYNASALGIGESAIGWQAKAGLTVARYAPRAVGVLMSVVSALLPKPGGIGHESAAGRDSTSPLSESFLTAPNRHAQEQYGQV